MQPDLFDPAVITGRYALWKRDSRRCKWRLVGTADTELGASRLMRGSGEFIVIEGSRHPDADRATSEPPGPSEGT